MAKRKNGGAAQTNENADIASRPALPEGFKKVDSDIIGFWQSDMGPIFFVPEEATVSDSKLEPQKPSGLIRGTLVQGCEALLNSDGEQVVGKPGDRVGVWAKPGMRELKALAGAKVFMFADGEKDTGKPNAMALFEIATADGKLGNPLPIEDRRKQSRGHASWLAPAILA
jgi:hypothetical protein